MISSLENIIEIYVLIFITFIVKTIHSLLEKARKIPLFLPRREKLGNFWVRFGKSNTKEEMC